MIDWLIEWIGFSFRFLRFSNIFFYWMILIEWMTHDKSTTTIHTNFLCLILIGISFLVLFFFFFFLKDGLINFFLICDPVFNHHLKHLDFLFSVVNCHCVLLICCCWWNFSYAVHRCSWMNITIIIIIIISIIVFFSKINR